MLIVCCVNSFIAQQQYRFSFSKNDEECNKGDAHIQIDTIKANDIVTLNWSNGQNNVSSIYNLSAGNYSLYILIKATTNTLVITKVDTTIYFDIEKQDCQIAVSNHFTPNSDNFNDALQIYNIDKYPNFELVIFNKWGQQVHSQKQKYVPWNGTWNGLPLPDETYYYVLYYDSGDKQKFLKGDITILR